MDLFNLVLMVAASAYVFLRAPVLFYPGLQLYYKGAVLLRTRGGGKLDVLVTRILICSCTTDYV